MKNLINFHNTVETGVDPRRVWVTNRSESKLIRTEDRAYASGHQQIIDTDFIILHSYSIFRKYSSAERFTRFFSSSFSLDNSGYKMQA